MKKTLSSILLLTGTILGALAAAEGEKPWVPATIEELASAEPPAVLFEALGVFGAGTVVAGEVLTNLTDAGFAEIKVLRHPITSETIRFSDPEEVAERVLETEIWGADQDPDAEGARPLLSAGAFLDESALERLAESGVSEVTLKVPGPWSFDRWGALWWFLLAVGMMLAAVFLGKSSGSKSSESTGDEKRSGYEELKGILSEVHRGAEALIPNVEGLEASVAAEQIEQVGEGVLALVERRSVLAQRMGVGAYAEFMSVFSTAERDLNRSWSAAVDGYPQEAKASLERASLAFGEAHGRL